MSFTEIYVVTEEGRVDFLDEVRNSSAGCNHIWSSMSKKYGVPFSTYDNKVNKDFWRLADSGKMDSKYDLLLKSTYDYAVVRMELLDELIEAFKQFIAEFGGINIGEQLKILESLPRDEGYIGVCWNQTSLNDFLWAVETEDDMEPYNVNKGKKHFWVEKYDATDKGLKE